jgi:SAM-dependent methyltransferase
MDLYKLYPDFIDRDPRKHRALPYAADEATMNLRHSIIFKNTDWRGKRVLDLGCCVGYSGAWALHNGAALYHGVEGINDFSVVAEQNLAKYFYRPSWKITHAPVEHSINEEDKYDIVIALGVFTAFKEPVTVLTQLSKIATEIYIESSHPSIFSRLGVTEQDADKIAIIDYQANQGMNVDMTFKGFRPSRSLIKTLLLANGFTVSDFENTAGKEEFPDLYNMRQRFILRATRSKEIECKFGFLETITT